MNRLLLTGFGPFDRFTMNPSSLLVHQLDGRVLADRLVVSKVFATETETIEAAGRAAVDEVQPDFVIATGLAQMRPSLSIERIAINYYEHPGPDAAGRWRARGPLRSTGPAGRLATLPIDEIKGALDAHGIPSYISSDAGTFCCNQLLYALLEHAESRSIPIPCGFIHLPLLPPQAVEFGARTAPSMSLESMTEGLEIAIEAISVAIASGYERV